MNKILKTTLGCAMLLSATAASAGTFVGGRTDFRDETIYFAMTTRFYDGDPTNNVCGWDRQNVQIANNDPDWRGDFKGLIDKLDYIKALGFTSIWITPIVQNSSGTDFHGYHGMDMSTVDLRYESRKAWGASQDVTLQTLVDECHKRGMKLVVDIVLNHTGNFGEANLQKLFTRSQDIRNQASVSASMIPNYDKLPADYNDLAGAKQYAARFAYLKNTGGKNLDNHNYWHHLANAWNWDYPSRWWGQIAGDCVDLNTENPAVSKYLVSCYEKFIALGVDGFRIDTTGHLSRLTFNTSFIPQFTALGEKYKDKRVGGTPFFMFGECCARYSEPTYRDQPNLSCYYYTWKSPQASVDAWNWDEKYWDNVEILEGNDNMYGNMELCLAEPSDQPTSDNVFMKNGAWHEPDHSRYSNFSIIDFPMHYNFNNAAAAVDVANKGDKYYNDASYNVVYVDSHDYCPGPNDGTRFNGGTAQWAENLSLMFTFRGIPCIYYGSEVEFQKGQKVDGGGTDMPVKNTGRAYFGHYLEGSVTATDFGVYTASGNVATTLDGDLANHIRRLNMIRAAVPALRKGQYTFDGCKASGGWAFKRAYQDSYALVAINGGATFSNVPAGTYTDLVTGETFQGGGSITVKAPGTQGQLRVLVKDWTGGKVGEDGKFIYATAPVAHGGNPTFEDPGTTQFYTAADAVGEASVSFSPAGGTFTTETLTVTATLNNNAASGWYRVAGGQQVNLTVGQPAKFELGRNMAFGESVKVEWGAVSPNGQTYGGTLTYKKVDPSASITVYVQAPAGTNMYAWGTDNSGATVTPCGAWPGKLLNQTVTVAGREFYYVTFADMPSVNMILNKDGKQTPDISGIDSDCYYEYDGATTVTKVDIDAPVMPSVKFSPNGGKFTDKVTVTATVANATSAWYKVGNNAQTTISGTTATFTIGEDMAEGESVTVSWSATNAEGTRTGEVKFTKQTTSQPPVTGDFVVYYDNSVTNWTNVLCHYWGGEASSSWPGGTMQQDSEGLWFISLPTGTTGVVFNNGSGQQTNDIKPEHQHIYRGLGDRNYEDMGENNSGVDNLTRDDANAPVEYYNLQGMRVDNPTRGIYIMRQGKHVEKVYVY